MEAKFTSHAYQDVSKEMMCSKHPEGWTNKLIQSANTGFPVKGS